MGVAFAGAGTDIAHNMVIEADAAMYAVKRRGGAGHALVDLRDVPTTETHDDLEEHLRVAV